MKSLHIAVILLVLPVLLLVSCKKDMAKPLPELMVGKWKLDSMYMSIHLDGLDKLIGLTNQYERVLEFKADRTYRDTSSTTFVRYGTWVLSDSMLTMDDRQNETSRIIQLDDVQLKLQHQSSENVRTYNWYSRIQ